MGGYFTIAQVERKHGLLSHDMRGVNSDLTKCYREHERYKTEEKVNRNISHFCIVTHHRMSDPVWFIIHGVPELTLGCKVSFGEKGEGVKGTIPP